MRNDNNALTTAIADSIANAATEPNGADEVATIIADYLSSCRDDVKYIHDTTAEENRSEAVASALFQYLTVNDSNGAAIALMNLGEEERNTLYTTLQNKTNAEDASTRDKLLYLFYAPLFNHQGEKVFTADDFNEALAQFENEAPLAEYQFLKRGLLARKFHNEGQTNELAELLRSHPGHYNLAHIDLELTYEDDELDTEEETLSFDDNDLIDPETESDPPSNSSDNEANEACELSELSDDDENDSELSGVNLRGAHLQYANLFGARLPSAELSDANLFNAELAKIELQDANINADTELTGTCIEKYRDYLNYTNVEQPSLTLRTLLSGYLGTQNHYSFFTENRPRQQRHHAAPLQALLANQLSEEGHDEARELATTIEFSTTNDDKELLDRLQFFCAWQGLDDVEFNVVDAQNQPTLTT